MARFTRLLHPALRLLTLAAILLTSVVQAQQNWQWMNPLPGSIAWKGSAFGNGIYVVVGTHTIATSADGVTWTSRQISPNALGLNAVAFAEGRFVAVGSGAITGVGNAVIATSSDGITWSVNENVASTMNAQLFSVAHGNGIWVVTGGSQNRILTSTNGTDWTARNVASSTGTVAFGGGRFVALTNNNRAITSTNGIDWTAATINATNGSFYTGLAYGGGRFVVVGSNGTSFDGASLTSTDGQTWTAGTAMPDSSSGVTWVAYANGAFAAGGNGGLFSSTDGATWTKRTSAMPPARLASPNSLGTENISGVASANNLLFTFGIYGSITTSSDGIAWARRSTGTSHDINGLVHDGTRFVGVGTGGTVVTSPDGVAWTAQATNQTGWFGKLAYANGRYAAAGLNGLHTSTNLTTWTGVAGTTSNQMWGVVYGGNRFVAVNSGISQGVLVSSDGAAWTTNRITGAAGNVLGFAHGGGTYVLVCGAGGVPLKIFSSNDAATWTDRTPAGFTVQPNAVAYANGRFAIVVGLTAWTSPDGVTWTSTPIPFGGPVPTNLMSLGDKFIARENSQFVQSTDAINWTRIPNSLAPNIVIAAMIEKDGKVYATGGGGAIIRGDVASSVVTPPPGPPSAAGRLINLSVRTNAGTGDNTLIVGLGIGGAGTSGDTAVLLRGVGPALTAFGVTGALADPVMTVFSGQTQIESNDDWAGGFNFASVGAFAFPANSRDAGIYADEVGAGAYSIQITGKGGATGVALAEIYDAMPAASFTATTPRLINVSARTHVGTGDNILIVGFAIGGTTPVRLLVRAVGPSLAAFGVGGTLADPKLEIYTGSTKTAENDNWTAADATTFSAVGAFGLTANSRDAAAVVTLQPGTYTAQVSGVGNTTGVALVEVYQLP